MVDIPLRDVSLLTGVSNKTVAKARASIGMTSIWPYKTVANGVNREYHHEHVVQMRAAEIEKTGPVVKRILKKVERRSEQLCLQSTSLQRGVDRDEPRVCRPTLEMSVAETEEVVWHMIDLPVVAVSKLLKISTHTLMDIRKAMQITKWPYDLIARGMYHESKEAIQHKRRMVMLGMAPSCVARSVLEAAVDMCAAIEYCKTQSKTESEWDISLSGLDDDENENERERLIRDWNGILVTPPCTPAAAKPSSEDHWVDEFGSSEGDSFWGEGPTMSPEEQAYWDSLMDLSH